MDELEGEAWTAPGGDKAKVNLQPAPSLQRPDLYCHQQFSRQISWTGGIWAVISRGLWGMGPGVGLKDRSSSVLADNASSSARNPNKIRRKTREGAAVYSAVCRRPPPLAETVTMCRLQTEKSQLLCPISQGSSPGRARVRTLTHLQDDISYLLQSSGTSNSSDALLVQ